MNFTAYICINENLLCVACGKPVLVEIMFLLYQSIFCFENAVNMNIQIYDDKILRMMRETAYYYQANIASRIERLQ